MFCLFTSDLHGRKMHYEKIYNLYKMHKLDLIIIGGDLFKYTHNKEEQISFLINYLKDFFNSFSIPIIILPGNSDWPVSIKTLEELKLSKINIIGNNKSLTVNGTRLIGYEYVRPHVFRQKHGVKRDLKEDEFIFDEDSYISDDEGNIIKIDETFLTSQTSIEEDLKELCISDAIWITHSPPYGGKLDLTADKIHIGSQAITRKIRSIQPKLVLSGHVHEAPIISGSWVDKIGNSFCINPGQDDKFHGVLFEIDENIKLKYLEHTVYGRHKL